MKRSTTKWRGLVILAGVLIIAGLLLGACGSSSDGGGGASPSAAGTPKPGGTYNYQLGAEPVAMDPTQAYEDQGMQVEYQCFQGLVIGNVDDQGNLVAEPMLAESWDTTDNKTFTFHLKQGVMFAPPVDREVTAQDFVDSWTYVTDPKNASPVSYILAPVEG
jgi:oligopeptide transport system substrate-binding protein